MSREENKNQRDGESAPCASHCSAAVHCMESSEDILTVVYDQSGNAFTNGGLCEYVNHLARELENSRDLHIKYSGRLAELRQCEDDRNQAWRERDELRQVVNRMERALLQIVTGRNAFQGPSLDYMQGYRDGQEHQARIARKALGHGQ